MDRNKSNISKIETYLYGIFDGVVSENTYVGTLPDTIQSSWSDMCLIEVPSGISDMDAFGRGSVIVWLYARPLINGSKNVALLSQLEQRLLKAVDEAKSDTYQISRRSMYQDYDTNRNWHCNIVILNLSIY
jgi:hypothetical protein